MFWFTLHNYVCELLKDCQVLITKHKGITKHSLVKLLFNQNGLILVIQCVSERH